MRLKHPKTISAPRSVEKLFSMKRVSGAKKVGGHCNRGSLTNVKQESDMIRF